MDTFINSTDIKTLKESRKFEDSTIFEGMTSISAVINSDEFNDRKIERVFYDSSNKKNLYGKLAFLRSKSVELDFELIPVNREYIDSLTIGSSHGGVIAMCSERRIPFLSSCELKKEGFYVMLEGIEDPYNFGYCLRSLYAAGVDGIVLSKRNWMNAAGVVCRSSAGASELLPLYIDEDGSSADLFRSLGYKVICAGIRNSVSFYDADMRRPVFLIIGGEKRGISSATISKADQIVRIDYAMNFKGSLSAASTATVLGFEVMRQNKIAENFT